MTKTVSSLPEVSTVFLHLFFGSLLNTLLCLVGELTGGGSMACTVAVAVGVSVRFF